MLAASLRDHLIFALIAVRALWVFGLAGWQRFVSRVEAPLGRSRAVEEVLGGHALQGKLGVAAKGDDGREVQLAGKPRLHLVDAAASTSRAWWPDTRRR